MTMNTLVILDWMWAALGAYWLFSAWRAEKSVTHEASFWRVGRLAILAATFILLLSRWTGMGPLAWRVVPDWPLAHGLGIALTAAGILLCVWARVHLGKFWSDKIVLKADHQLIRSGPYSRLRHPIYSGMLLGIAGTTIALGELRGAVAFALLGTSYFIKAVQEERLLAAQFGEEFRTYRRQTGFVVPRW